MRPLSQALNDLIKCAEDIVHRPVLLAAYPPASFFDLVGEIDLADQRPAENFRTTRSAMVMCPAIENFYADPKGDHHWQMVIGTILPLLRTDAYQQFQHERESLKSEASR